MPEQVSDITSVLASVEEFPESLKTMLLEGLPHATKGGCSHPYTKQLLTLVGGLLEGTNQTAQEALGSSEAELAAAEKTLEEVKASEAEASTAADASAEATAASEAGAKAAAQKVKSSTKEHAQAEKESAAFFKKRKEEQAEKSRVAAVVEGPLRVLVDGGWDDEDAKAGAIKAVSGLLGDVSAEQVLTAAAPRALGQKPDSRGKFDCMAVDAIMKVLPSHLSSLEAKLKESDFEETHKKAELLGLWAIADVSGDAATAAAAALDAAKEKQTSASKELDARCKQTKREASEVSEKAAKRTRVSEHLAAIDQALAAVAHFSTEPAPGGTEPSTADAPAETVA